MAESIPQDPDKAPRYLTAIQDTRVYDDIQRLLSAYWSDGRDAEKRELARLALKILQGEATAEEAVVLKSVATLPVYLPNPGATSFDGVVAQASLMPSEAQVIIDFGDPQHVEYLETLIAAGIKMDVAFNYHLAPTEPVDTTVQAD
jgi:hypothetical protein